MNRRQRITAIICAFALAVSNFEPYMGDAKAVYKMVTPDDGTFSREATVRGAERSNGADTDAQRLKSGERVDGWLFPGKDRQTYKVTLKKSGQLNVRLEGDEGKFVGHLTDQNGKKWASRKSETRGIYIYQLKKGTYYFHVQAAKSVEIPKEGLDYAVLATVASAKAEYENNTTRKKAAKLPLNRLFFGHLAQNAPEEYYKVTLKRVSCLSFSINTQVLYKTPETFVVSLYNKDGKCISTWENPDWTQYGVSADEDENWELGYYSDWIWNMNGDRQGLAEILEPGTYYLGVSVKRDGNGKIPASARYGMYAVSADVMGLGASLKLSYKQAEYTGKDIKIPSVTIKEYPQDPNYDYWSSYGVKDLPEYIWNMSTTDDKGDDREAYDRIAGIKEIGRYRIGDRGYGLYHPGPVHAYSIFTVTPVRGRINRLISRKTGQVQVSVRKNAKSTGYQIQIAADKNFRKSKQTLKISNVRKTIKGLSSGKKYYVRVRNYKDVETVYCPETSVSESIYGKWSKTGTIICK